jgi:ADP-heptose:LPS heptosyltransferase
MKSSETGSHEEAVEGRIVTNLMTSLMPSRLNENCAAWSSLGRVAWLRSGALGDLVVGLASLAEMPRFFPGAKVTVIGPGLWTELLDPEAMPFIEQIIVIARKRTRGRCYRARGAEWIAVEGEEQDLVQLLRDFDAFVNTNTDSYRYGFVALRAGVKLRIGSAPREMAWLYHYNAPYLGKDPLIHERDWPLILLEYAMPGWKRFMRSTASNRSALAGLLESSRLVSAWRKKGLPNLRLYSAERAQALTGLTRDKYFLVNPTSSRREKAWPPERVRELLLSLRGEFKDLDLVPLVIGAPTETEWLKEVAGAEFQILQPENLRDLQEIVRGARVLLTNVSSMQFIAATTQTPTLTVVGRSRPEIWGPVGFNDRMVRAIPENSTEDGALSIFEHEARMYQSIAVEQVKLALLPLIRQTLNVRS